METADDDSTLILSPVGDLKVLVNYGDQQNLFVVSSQAMGLASPVWQKMLDRNNGFKEGSRETGEISLPEADPETLLILFRIAHLQFQHVPQTISFRKLVDICTLCDEYDAITLSHPWLSRWKAHLSSFIGEDGYEEWLYIALICGDTDVFCQLARKMVRESALSTSSINLINPVGQSFEEKLPSGILGTFL